MNPKHFLRHFFIIFAICNTTHSSYNFTEQESIKKNMIFSNGKSFLDLECCLQTVFEPLPQCIIDTENKTVQTNCVTISNSPSLDPNLINIFIKNDTQKSVIFISPDIITIDYNLACFLLIRDIQKSLHYHFYESLTVLSSLLIIMPIVYKACTYNLVDANNSSISSLIGAEFIKFLVINQIIVPIILSTVTCTVKNLSIRNTDNFAIEHTDIDAQKAALTFFKNIETETKQQWQQNNWSDYIPFVIGQYIQNSGFPSIASRIQKLKTSLTCVQKPITQHQESDIE